MSAGGHRTHVVVTDDGTRLHVTEVGASARPAVLLLHGVGSSTRFLLEAFRSPLEAAGWRLLAVDLRGHGGSTALPDPAQHSFVHHVADVATLVDRFRPAVLAGVSLGGHAVVGAAAAGVPCEAVVACLPAWTGRSVPGDGPHAAVAAEVVRTSIEAMVARFREDTSMVPWLREVLLRDWPRHDAASLRAALLALDGGHAPTPTELRDLPVPLGLVGWPDDPGHPLAEARDWARLATTSHLVETSLAAVQEDRRAFGRALVAALEGVGATPGTVAAVSAVRGVRSSPRAE